MSEVITAEERARDALNGIGAGNTLEERITIAILAAEDQVKKSYGVSNPVTRATPDLSRLINDLKDLYTGRLVDSETQDILENIVEELRYCLENDEGKYIFFNDVWDDLLQETFNGDKRALEVAEEYAKTQGDVMVFRWIGTIKGDD